MDESNTQIDPTLCELECRLRDAGSLLSVDHVMHRQTPDRIAAIALNFEALACLIMADPRTGGLRIELARFKPDATFRFDSASLEAPWDRACGRRVAASRTTVDTDGLAKRISLGIGDGGAAKFFIAIEPTHPGIRAFYEEISEENAEAG